MVKQWLKIIGGSLLIALGVFSLIEAGISLDNWKLYTETTFVQSVRILDNVALLVFVGIPSLIIGSILVIKGTQEWLSR
jgi:uncharacterized membrane protein